MRSLSTQLRSAVIDVLSRRYGTNGLTDEDFAFINVCGTYADSREGGGVLSSDILKKIMDDRARQQSGPRAEPGPMSISKEAIDALRGAVPTKVPDSALGPKGAPGLTELSGMLGATGPDAKRADWPEAEVDDTEQAKLPLGEADRGPEPQDVETLLTTKPPVAEAEVPGIDPSDPPPDYTRLETAATRRIDT